MYGVFPQLDLVYLSISTYSASRDTVSSVGFIRQRPLPLTTSASHVCFFRHGLALDERRVKFLPEFLTDGRIASSLCENPESNITTNVKEVWFVGSHSDMYVPKTSTSFLADVDFRLKWREQ